MKSTRETWRWTGSLAVLLLWGGSLVWGQENAGGAEASGEDANAQSEEATIPETPEEYLMRLEWRGILSLPEGKLFSIHDAETGESFWIAEEEIRFGIEVIEYDRRQNAVTLAYDGAVRTLPLSGSSVRPLVEAPPEESPTFAGREDRPGVEGEEEESESTDLWVQAVAESGRLQEIDEQMQAILDAEAEVEETLEQSEEGQSDYDTALARREALRETRKQLAEMALTELENSSNLSDETRRALVEKLRAENGLSRDFEEGGAASENPEAEEDEAMESFAE